MSTRAVRLATRSRIILALTAAVTAFAFAWPLIFSGAVNAAGLRAPLIFGALLPVVTLLALTDMAADRIDAKALALMGVLAALGAVLRPLGAGTAGIELIFFLVILGGRVFGPGFGFMQGVLTLATSALLTAGVGPWLPYQMIAAGYVGLIAGLLPARPRGKAEIVMLCGYGAVSAFAYGAIMDFAFWPFATGTGGELSWDASASAWENLHTFVVYELATGTGWNLGRAVTNVVVLAVLGPGVLYVLRRANHRAFFADPVPSAARPPEGERLPGEGKN